MPILSRTLVPHLMNAHKKEVEAIMALPTRNSDRGYLINILRYRGNHFHNLAALKAKEGMFIPGKRINGRWKVS